MVHTMVLNGPKPSHMLHSEGFLTTKGAQRWGAWCTRWCQMVKTRHMCCILNAFSPQWVQRMGQNGAQDGAKWRKIVTCAAL